MSIGEVLVAFLLVQGTVTSQKNVDHPDNCEEESNYAELHEETAMVQTNLHVGIEARRISRTPILTERDAKKSIVHDLRDTVVNKYDSMDEYDELLANFTIPEKTGSAIVGVKVNAPGDLKTFISGVILHTTLITCVFCGFSVARRRYPLMYRYRELLSYEKGEVDDYGGCKPATPMENYGVIFKRSHIDSFFGWIRASYELTLDDFESCANLDHAMQIEFYQCMMKTLALMAIPMMCILAPIQACCGGNAAGKDYLSYIGIGNVTPNQYPWIYYIHAVTVYYVMFVVNFMIYRAQKNIFLPRRIKWLQSMRAPRSDTILVEHIPYEYRSDAKLKEYFNDLFGDSRASKDSPDREPVKEALVVKQTGTLCSLIEARKGYEEELMAARFKWEKEQKESTEKDGQQKKNQTVAAFENSEQFQTIQQSIKDTQKEIKAERDRILKESEKEGSDVYAENGFVTFKQRSQKELAVSVPYRPDDSEMIVSVPPGPEDVMYGDLQTSEVAAKFEALVGYGFVIGLFFGFLPLSIGISTLTNLNNLESEMPWLKSIFHAIPFIESPLKAVLGSLALTIFNDFLPTFLMLIFTCWFVLVAETWAQVKLQHYYFWFMVIFTVLVTAVGSSLVGTISEILQHPKELFVVIGESLPSSTHFYLNFIVMQWFTHALNLTRWFYFIKYKIAGWFFEEEYAKVKAEPEAQDYYGVGGRSARAEINMVIGLVFANLSPGIVVLVFINFIFERLIYGYLMYFAEIRKGDTGGVLWFASCQHIMLASMIYWICMVGLLGQRGYGWGECVITLPACLIFFFFWHRIHHTLRWESLPLEEIVHKQKEPTMSPLTTDPNSKTRDTYRQPELDREA